MKTVTELLNQIEQLQRENIDLKVDRNILEGQVCELNRQLADARREIADHDADTRTVQKLALLGDSDDDNGYDPRDTGEFRAWRGVIR